MKIDRTEFSTEIRSKVYGSFSVFDLYFPLLVGFLNTLILYLRELASRYLCEKEGYSQYGHLEWTLNETLELQRLAYDEVGSGTSL